MLSQAALQRRKKHIGASEVAALFGESPWLTPTDLYWSKVSKEIPEQNENASISMGNLTESLILDYASQDLGEPLLRNQFRVSKAEDGGILSATYDAISTGSDRFAVEAKYSVQHDQWGEADTDEVPLYYWLQCQAQILVLDLDQVFLYRLNPGGFGIQFDRYRIKPDQAAIMTIIEEAKSFWNDHVLQLRPPTDDPPPLELLKARKREPSKIVEVEDLELAERIFAEYQETNAKIKELSEHKELCQRSLIEMLGDGELAFLSDGKKISYKSFETKRLDTTALKKAHPDLVAEFTNKSTQYRFNLTEKKKS